MQKAPAFGAKNTNQILKNQLPCIEDEARDTGADDDEGEDLIKSINSLLNKGKRALRNKLKLELYENEDGSEAEEEA